MSRTPPHRPLALPPRAQGVPLVRWLYAALRDSILEGRLPPGTRLPSTRSLARQRGISRSTVVQVFEELVSHGYLESRVGAGTRVATNLPPLALGGTLAAPSERTSAGARHSGERRLSGYGHRIRPFREPESPRVHPFRAHQPALDLFPVETWARVAGRRLRRSGDLLRAGDPLGYQPLRAAVASYLATSRGTFATADRIAIVSGVQEGLDVTARLLLDPGDRVGMEDPGWDGARLVFEAQGAERVPMPVDGEGMVVDSTLLERCRLVYVTPAHQFPLGVAMSLPRRVALLEWAASTGATIFEDDYDSEYRYEGRPLPSLQGLDRAHRVVLAGSFGKVLFPALRIGYLVLPNDLVEPATATLSITRRHVPLLDQAILEDFITQGHFERHLGRMRGIYAERLATLTSAARERLAGRLDVSDVEAGLQTVGWLHPRVDATRAARAAARHGVEVQPLSVYGGGDRTRHGLHLGFAPFDPPTIRRAVAALEMALRDELAQPVLPGNA